MSKKVEITKNITQCKKRTCYVIHAQQVNCYLRCCVQRKKKVNSMCTAVSKIRGKTAQELLEWSGQGTTAPTDLGLILKKAGISVMPRDFSDIEDVLRRSDIDNDFTILGAIVMNKENAAIFYQQNDPEDGHRYRFTIAHEIAHCCLSHCGTNTNDVHIDFRRSGSAISQEEQDADIFAGELLIPERVLHCVLAELILPTIKTLADIFAVSKNVMRARLDYLTNISIPIIGYNVEL